MKISVIIPVYNSSKTVERCLNAVYESDFKDFEVIVVDDCSNDHSVDRVKKFPCKIVCLRENSGPAKARNVGAKNAKSEILFFIDSDVILMKNALGEVYKSYNSPAVTSVIGIYSKEPANDGFFHQYMALWKYYTWMYPKPPKYFSFFIASCGSIRKKDFDDLGGFNTEYKGADVEDYEFGYRLNKKNKILFNPKIQGKHYHPDFKACARNYYKRASQWFKIFIKRKKFDTGAASASRGASSMIALILIFVSASSFWLHQFSFAALALLGLFIFLNQGFYLMTLKEKGVEFMLRSIITNYVLSVIISMGVLKSVITYPFER